MQNTDQINQGSCWDKTEESNTLCNQLYIDLSNTMPVGVYRLRVFQNQSLIKNNWLLTNKTPYAVDFANDRFFEILQMDRMEFFQNPGILLNFIHVEDKDEFARLNVKANTDKTPFIWEGRFVIKKTIVWVYFKSIPRKINKNEVIWTGMIEDITERKKIEEDIQIKNEHLQKLITGEDYFMSLLAHDLKTPFNSILGFLELIQSNIHQYSITEIEKQISYVHKSATLAYDLLEDILTWALSESGKIPFNPEIIDFTSFCERVLEIMQPNATKKNIHIHILESKNIQIYADVNMMNTILRNLLSNAIKFSHMGGEINVSAVSTSSDVTIMISDNGIGISPDELLKLFDITKKYSSVGTANEKGTGLGLLICKEFVERHGGKIHIQSELKVGTQLIFTLPCLVKDSN